MSFGDKVQETFVWFVVDQSYSEYKVEDKNAGQRCGEVGRDLREVSMDGKPGWMNGSCGEHRFDRAECSGASVNAALFKPAACSRFSFSVFRVAVLFTQLAELLSGSLSVYKRVTTRHRIAIYNRLIVPVGAVHALSP